MNNSAASKYEIAQVVEILKKYKPGFLPLEIFLEITRLTVTPIIEIVPLRKTLKDQVEVLLLKRDKNDQTWPGMLHTPGTVLRSSDKEGTFEDAFERILKVELGLIDFKGIPNFAGYIFHQVKRGSELGLIFWIELTVNYVPKRGKHYPYTSLPNNIIATQIPHIDLAVNNYLGSVK